MKVIGIHCPYCGGNIKFDLETGAKHCFCIHCGQQIILDDEVIRTEHVERKVDEARIREAEISREIKMRELDMERKNSNFQSALKWVWLGVTIILIGVFIYKMEFSRGGYFSRTFGAYNFAIYVAFPIILVLGIVAFRKK